MIDSQKELNQLSEFIELKDDSSTKENQKINEENNETAEKENE